MRKIEHTAKVSGRDNHFLSTMITRYGEHPLLTKAERKRLVAKLAGASADISNLLVRMAEEGET